MRPWAERINEQGKGVVKIDIRDGLALANLTNAYERVVNDVVQIAWTLPGYVAGKFPRTQVTSLPFVSGNGEERLGRDGAALPGRPARGRIRRGRAADAGADRALRLADRKAAQVARRPCRQQADRHVAHARRYDRQARRYAAIDPADRHVRGDPARHGRRRRGRMDGVSAVQARRGHQLPCRDPARRLDGHGVHGQEEICRAAGGGPPRHRRQFRRGREPASSGGSGIASAPRRAIRSRP